MQSLCIAAKFSQGLPLPFIAFCRDPAIWGADANAFRPERWEDEQFSAKLHPCAYLPFSKGPRDCIGQTFAILEAKAVLAMLYQKLTFRYASDKPEKVGSAGY